MKEMENKSQMYFYVNNKRMEEYRNNGMKIKDKKWKSISLSL